MNRRQALALLAGAPLAGKAAASPGATGLPVAVLSDGVTAVLGLLDGTLRRLRLDGSEPAAPLAGHEGRTSALVALSDGRFLSAGEDGRIRLWRPGRATPAHELFSGHGPVKALAASEAIGGVAAGFADGRIRVWFGMVDPKPLVFSGHQGAVTGIAFSGGRISVVSGGRDATVRRTGLMDGKVTTHETEGPVTHLAGVFDGETVAAIGFGEIAVFSPEGTERLTLRAFTGAAAALAISPDGEWIASLDGSGRAFVFDRFGGRPYWSDPVGEGRAAGLTFHPDSLRLVLPNRDLQLRIAQVRTGG